MPQLLCTTSLPPRHNLHFLAEKRHRIDLVFVQNLLLTSPSKEGWQGPQAEARQPVALPKAGAAVPFLADVCPTSDPQQLQFPSFLGQIHSSVSQPSYLSYTSLNIISAHSYHQVCKKLSIPFLSVAVLENPSTAISSPCSSHLSRLNSLSHTTFFHLTASILRIFLVCLSVLCFPNYLFF